MKTSNSLLFALAFLFTLGQASAMSNDKGKNAFSKKIQSVLSTPKCLKNKASGEKITVVFVVNDTGDVTEANAKTTNAEIKQHLQKQFLTLNLKGLEPCVTHSIDVNFVNY